MKGSMITAAAAAALSLCSHSSAQILWGASYTQMSDPDRVMGGGAQMLIPQGGAPSLASADNSMNLTGDVTCLLPTFNDTDRYTFEVYGIRSFIVGALPVSVGINVVANGKIVNAGSNFQENLITRVVSESWIYAANDDFPIGGSSNPSILSALGLFNTDVVLSGQNAAYQVFDTFSASDQAAILTPGRSYYFVTGFIVSINVPAYTPNASVNLEFGGISAYDGLRASIAWQTVPTPGPAVLAALATIVAARRVRRPV